MARPAGRRWPGGGGRRRATEQGDRGEQDPKPRPRRNATDGAAKLATRQAIRRNGEEGPQVRSLRTGWRAWVLGIGGRGSERNAAVTRRNGACGPVWAAPARERCAARAMTRRGGGAGTPFRTMAGAGVAMPRSTLGCRRLRRPRQTAPPVASPERTEPWSKPRRAARPRLRGGRCAPAQCDRPARRGRRAAAPVAPRAASWGGRPPGLAQAALIPDLSGATCRTAS